MRLKLFTSHDIHKIHKKTQETVRDAVIESTCSRSSHDSRHLGIPIMSVNTKLDAQIHVLSLQGLEPGHHESRSSHSVNQVAYRPHRVRLGSAMGVSASSTLPSSLSARLILDVRRIEKPGNQDRLAVVGERVGLEGEAMRRASYGSRYCWKVGVTGEPVCLGLA
jgi:hypothetical protein